MSLAGTSADLPLTLASIREAAVGLAGVAIRTPLVESAVLSRQAGVPVFLKCEQLQPVGAFKVRGAYTAIRRLPPERRRRGVVTHSSGNHGIAVGWAARRLEVPAVVVAPEDAPRVKLEAIAATGAELVRIPDRSLREPTVERLVRERGLVSIPPFDHLDVMAGQATVGLEILEQCPEVAVIVAAVSGGGLLGGIASAAAWLRPQVRVIGAEPEGAAKLTAALARGAPARVAQPRSIADGLLAPALGTFPWRAIRSAVHGAAVVNDREIGDAVRFLFERQGLRVEPSGAVPVAALLAGRVQLAGPVAAVLSGGNLDPDVFRRLVEG